GAGFFAGVEPALEMRWQAIALYAGAGIAAAVLGGLLPALEAARAQPALALKAGDEEVAYTPLPAPRAPLVLLFLRGLVVALPPVNGLPLFGYAGIMLMMIGTIALIPWLSALVFARLRVPRGAICELALSQLRGASAATALGLAGIVAAVGLMVAMAIMVTSFRNSLDEWLRRILPADLYVRASVSGETAYLDEQAQRAIARVPGVARVEFLRSQQILLDP